MPFDNFKIIFFDLSFIVRNLPTGSYPLEPKQVATPYIVCSLRLFESLDITEDMLCVQNRMQDAKFFPFFVFLKVLLFLLRSF